MKRFEEEVFGSHSELTLLVEYLYEKPCSRRDYDLQRTVRGPWQTLEGRNFNQCLNGIKGILRKFNSTSTELSTLNKIKTEAQRRCEYNEPRQITRTRIASNRKPDERSLVKAEQPRSETSGNDAGSQNITGDSKGISCCCPWMFGVFFSSEKKRDDYLLGDVVGGNYG